MNVGEETKMKQIQNLFDIEMIEDYENEKNKKQSDKVVEKGG